MRRPGVRRFLLDVEPLRRDRDYRWLWSGLAVSGMGNQITRLALPFQVYTLTGSTLAVAALTAFQLVPILLFALAAGSLADAVDRRRLLLVTQSGMALCSLVLAALALNGDPPLLALYAVAFVAAGLAATDSPARSSTIPRLVPPDRLPAALALAHLNFEMASIVGPAVAGIVIATVGLTGAYLLDVVTFAASVVAVLAIRPVPPLGGALRPGLAAIREGLGYVRRRRVVLSTFALDLDAMVLATPTALFPAIALDVFQVGPEGLGFLVAAPAAGAILGVVLSGWISRVDRLGRVAIAAVAGWGTSIAAFGAVTLLQDVTGQPAIGLYLAALVTLACAGAADLVSTIARNTIVQLDTPDELRGRVMSVHSLVVTSGPRVGDIQSAVVASVIGPGQAVLAGGIACLAGVGAVARWLPELPRHVVVRARVRPATEPAAVVAD